MKDFHGIIFAYRADPELRELVGVRTTASLPFCGRYRLIDLALSAMKNAGILDVGVIMQRDYQSLLDHIGSGKAWDMSRRTGGLRMLPPFGLPEYHRGEYTGTIEALNAVAPYIRDIPEKYLVLMIGNLCANLDLTVPMEQHKRSGAEITAICADHALEGEHHRYIVDENGFATKALLDRTDEGEGLPSLECYIINKDTLLKMMDECKANNLYRFHHDAIVPFLNRGGKLDTYVHPGYAAAVRSVGVYYQTSMDMLKPQCRRSIFPADRPVRTKAHEEVSSYYGERAKSVNSLVADNCKIEGSIENCIIFSGCRIEAGAKLKDCIVMRGGQVGANAELDCLIVDKYCSFSEGTKLTGNKKLPTVVPKGTKI